MGTLQADVVPRHVGQGHFLKDLELHDPKAVFANERTMLHYAEKGLYIGSLGIVLLHIKQNEESRINNNAVGILLVAMTIAYLIWILVEYQNRLRVITSQAGCVARDKMARFDISHGPLVVA